MTQQKSSMVAIAELFLVVFALVLALQPGASVASPLPGGDDERYVEREYPSSSPGAHELATWLIAQLRQTSNQAAAANSVTGCRCPTAAKRNSEIINSLMRLPQMENGRK